MERKKITFDIFIRGLIVIILFIGTLMLLNRLSGVLLPFFAAMLLSYLIFPMVKFFQYKLRFKFRILAILLSFLVITGIIAAIVYFLIPPIVEECIHLKDLIVSYFQYSAGESNIPKVINEWVQKNIDQQSLMKLFNQREFMQSLRDAVPKVWAVISQSFSLVTSLVSFVMVILYTLFILLDYERITEGWPNLLPMRYRKFCIALVNDTKNAMNRYFRGQATIALSVGILFSIGFLIIDFPLAIGLGLFIGLLNMVPYLQVVGFIPTILLAILKAAETGQNFWLILLAALIVFTVVQAIQDIILTPRIMGKVTGLYPAIILLSLSIWGSLMGMLGMIIALPLTTLLISYYQRYIIHNEQEQQDSDKDREGAVEFLKEQIEEEIKKLPDATDDSAPDGLA